MAAFHETYDFYITPSTAYTAPKVGELTHSKVEQEKLRTQLTEIQSSEYQDFVYDMFLPSLTYSPFTQLANLTGQPAVSLPIHLSEQRSEERRVGKECRSRGSQKQSKRKKKSTSRA